MTGAAAPAAAAAAAAAGSKLDDEESEDVVVNKEKRPSMKDPESDTPNPGHPWTTQGAGMGSGVACSRHPLASCDKPHKSAGVQTLTNARSAPDNESL